MVDWPIRSSSVESLLSTKEVISAHDIHNLKVDNIYELEALLCDLRLEPQS